MPSIKDVAKLAGVSTATVSRVLNGSDLVSEQSRIEVKAAIEKLNYVPNNLGLALRRSETRIIMLYSQLHIKYSEDFLNGLYNAAEKNGYFIMNYVSAGSRKLEQEFLARAENKLVDGVIFVACGFSVKELLDMNSRFPLVVASSFMSDGIPSVSIDSEKAGYDATMHLLNSGRKRIAMLCMDNDEKMQYLDDRVRLKGYMRALAEHKIEFDPGLVYFSAFNYRSGYKITEEIIDSGKEIDGIICTHDAVAIGCENAALDRGIRIPEDLAIITIDASDYCEIARPQITSVSQPWYDIGRESVLSIIRQKTLGKNYEAHPIFLDHRIIARQST